MGIAAALVFANLGSAYGTAKSGVGIVSVAVLKPDLLFRSIIPVVMAGVLGMYGMIIAILMKQNSKYQSSTASRPVNNSALTIDVHVCFSSVQDCIYGRVH